MDASELSKHTPEPWRAGRDAGEIIAGEPRPGNRTDELYGGQLIAESVSANNFPLIIAAPALLAERDKLQAFKVYVHSRLDAAGVPVDPDSPHKAEGCRIGGRLDWVLARAAQRHELLVVATDAANFIRYALEFFNWAQFPSVEETVEALRDKLKTAIDKAEGGAA